jgi:methylmalonyl-CoA/ethylmalonyl-CoA epimerase
VCAYRRGPQKGFFEVFSGHLPQEGSVAAPEDRESRRKGEVLEAMLEGVHMRFDHVSLAVRSIDRAYDFFKTYFPIQLRNEKRAEEQVSGSFHWQDFWLGGFAIEMIEDPPGRPGFVSRFIERRGEGMHHLSVEVDNLDALVAALKQDGVRVVDEQSFPDGSRTAFISPRSSFGVLIQFWEHSDSTKPAPPAERLARFDHVSIAVKDINRAMEFFARHFAAKVVREPHLSNSEGNFIIGQMEAAGFKLEFLQSPGPGTRNDFVARFIERYGEGMHHISLDLARFDEALAKLRAGGVRVVDEKRNFRGERQFFISPSSAFGVLIQVWDGLDE